MKRILICGGAGSIGSELVRQLVDNNKIYVLDTNESGLFELTDSLRGKEVWGRVGDIRDYKTVKDVFDDFKPQIVYNCAAYKHVPLMEYTPLEAINTNVLGHYNLIHVAKTWECVEKFVYVSTDKAVNSHSIMGATKRLGEILTRNSGYTVVRFGNVLGSRGSLLTIWAREFAEGKPLSITDERMERYTMSIPEAVELIVEATEHGKGGETFIMNMGKQKRVVDLKEELYPGYPTQIVGIRQGETLSERLMTEEEENVAVKNGRFWIV